MNYTTKTETRKRRARGERSIRVEAAPPGTAFDSPGEYDETCDRTREGLTHATAAFRAPDISGDAFTLRDDPP